MRVGSDPRPSRPAVGRPGGRPRRSARTLALALAATATVGLAACGGDDGDDEATVAPDASGSVTTAPVPPAGGSDEQTKAAAVVTQYIAAFSAGDGDAVCRLYTREQRARIADAFGGTCAAGIRASYAQGGGDEGFKRSLGNLRVGNTAVDGRRAVVRLVALQNAGGDQTPLEVELERSGDRWRISRPSGSREDR